MKNNEGGGKIKNLERIWVSSFCQQGVQRTNNEDCVFFRDFPHERYTILGVADGMGGLEGGESASALVCRLFNEPLTDNPENELRERAKIANSLLYNDERKLGTTIAVLVIDKKQSVYFALSVGDSRIYKYSDFSLEQVSTDDSFYPNASAISKAIGINSSLSRLEIISGETRRGDSWLLSTDGIHSFVKNDDIKETIILHKKNNITVEIAKQALNRGSGDDMTTVFCVIN